MGHAVEEVARAFDGTGQMHAPLALKKTWRL
jgi:hypothetical protein